MGVLRFFRRLNCFGFSQRKVKSRRKMENELCIMQEAIRIIEEDIQNTRITVEECKQRQRAAEEKEEMTRNTRSHLMAQVQLTESRLGRALEKRQMLMSEIIECGIRKMALEEKLQAMERKTNFFWNDVQSGDPKESAKKWRENLRRVRSQNDMNKAVPQPPLFPIRDFDDNELKVWADWASQELSFDNIIPETENWEESAAITETFL
ncbi:uncharacterized protein LOC144649886 [Oculina patagonica]